MIIKEDFFSCFELRKDEFVLAYAYYPGILAKFKIIRDDNNNVTAKNILNILKMKSLDLLL